MKDFDTDPTTSRGARLADREFTLGGLPFKLRPAKDVPSDAIDRWRVVWAQMTDPDAPPVMDPDFTAAWLDFMANAIEPEQVETFREHCKPGAAPDPITIPDAVEVIVWAVGVVAARPMGASSASSNGSTAPTTVQAASSSTEASSSPAPAGSAL
jgi:hypothetical protein